MKYSSTDFQILQTWQRRVSGCRLYHLDVAQFSFLNLFSNAGITRVESPVEGTEQRFANIICFLVASFSATWVLQVEMKGMINKLNG